MEQELLKGALILEGGGMRGVYTCGVLDYFMEQNLYFDACYGVSAGASHGSSYASKQMGRPMKIIRQYVDTKEYGSFQNLLRTGDFFDRQFHTEKVVNEYVPFDYEAFKKNPMKFYCVVTNCDNGNPEYIEIKDMKKEMDWIWASISLPWFSAIVHIDGHSYLDGGMADSIPLEKAREDGYQKAVVVLTRDKTYVKKPQGFMRATKVKYHKYKKLVETLRNRHVQYNKTLQLIEKLEANGEIIVIRPKKPVEIGRLEKNLEKLNVLYQEGYEDAKEKYEEILRLFQPREVENENSI